MAGVTRDEVQRFPEVIYIRQEDSGSAAARSTGCAAAVGTYSCSSRPTTVWSQALAAGLDNFAAHPKPALLFSERSEKSMPRQVGFSLLHDVSDIFSSSRRIDLL
jgi:hypothetical protein